MYYASKFNNHNNGNKNILNYTTDTDKTNQDLQPSHSNTKSYRASTINQFDKMICQRGVYNSYSRSTYF
jgi:hypothetical protein